MDAFDPRAVHPAASIPDEAIPDDAPRPPSPVHNPSSTTPGESSSRTPQGATDMCDLRLAHPAASVPDEAIPYDAPRSPSPSQSNTATGSNFTPSDDSSTRPLLPTQTTTRVYPIPRGTPPPRYSLLHPTPINDNEVLAPDPASAQQDQPQAQGQDRPQLGGGAGDVDGGGGEGDVDALPQYHDLENGIVAANQGDPNAKQASAPIAVQSQRGNNRFTRAWYRYCWRRGRRRVVWILVVIFAMLGLALTVYFSLKQAKRHHMGGGHDDDDDSDDDSDDDD